MSTTTDTHALVDDLAARIRAKIMSGAIPIGSPLRQAELAAEFGISRTPVREALRQLQSGGLIEVMPNRGAIVRVPAPWEVREVYEIRAELEALAARRAVQRLSKDTIGQLREVNRVMFEYSESVAAGKIQRDDSAGSENDRFHTLIYRASGNDRLERMLADINDAFPRSVSAHVLRDDARHREENFTEHEKIVEAFASGDGELAASLMRDHVMRAGDILAHWYERRSGTVFKG